MRSLILFCLLLLTYQTKAQSGILDSTFGKDGTVITSFNNDYTLCFSSTLQHDGKIIAVGQGNKKINDQLVAGFLVVRYNPDGSIDNSFGDEGRVITPFENGLAEAHAAQVLADGRILVVGYGSISGSLSNNDVFIVRYKENGSVDSTFGTNGIIRTDLNFDEGAIGLKILPDNSFYVCGYSAADFLLLHYLGDGNLDKSFGTNGYSRTAFTSGIAKAMTLDIQLDGKILTAGIAGSKAAFARYLSNGKLDVAFGINGTFSTNYQSSSASVNALKLLPDGSFIAGGAAGSGFAGSMVVAKYQSGGSPYLEFGKKGILEVDFNGFDSRVKSVDIQSDGKIVLIGDTYNAFNGEKNNFALCRVLKDGLIDSSFGDNGKTITDFEVSYYESVASGFLNAQQQIIVTGYPNNFMSPSGYFVLLSKYNAVSQKQIIITKIKRWLQHHNGFTWDNNNNVSSYVVQRSYDGIHFSSIAKINAGSSSNTYADPSPLSGNNYYRLQTTSNDGAVNYSNVLAVNAQLLTVNISPNPAKNVLHIEGLSSSNKTKITVVDFSGNISLIQQLSTVNSSYNLNIAALKPGNYLLKIETDGEVVRKKFVKE